MDRSLKAAFTQTLYWGDLDNLHDLEKAGLDLKSDNINAILNNSGWTALHYAAHRSLPDIVRYLCKNEHMDYLVITEKGQLPSELAYKREGSAGQEIGQFLAEKEVSQAKARDIDFQDILNECESKRAVYLQKHNPEAYYQLMKNTPSLG